MNSLRSQLSPSRADHIARGYAVTHVLRRTNEGQSDSDAPPRGFRRVCASGTLAIFALAPETIRRPGP
jgi:hypothetical protein